MDFLVYKTRHKGLLGRFEVSFLCLWTKSLILSVSLGDYAQLGPSIFKIICAKSESKRALVNARWKAGQAKIQLCKCSLSLVLVGTCTCTCSTMRMHGLRFHLCAMRKSSSMRNKVKPTAAIFTQHLKCRLLVKMSSSLIVGPQAILLQHVSSKNILFCIACRSGNSM